MKTRIFLFSISAALLVSLSMSCVMPDSNLGSISLSIAQEVSNSRNLLPNLDMEPATYVVSGTGPSGSTFTPVTITGTSTSIEKLVAGSWTITVEAYNADATPTKIGTGKTTILISDGRTTETSVIVKPLTGNGTLTLNLTWPADILVTPQVVATMKPTTGAVQTITFNVGTTSATYTSDTVPAGYYTLAISLNEGTTNVAGKSDIVRIVEGEPTIGTYNFTTLNPAGGTASVTITPELADPFIVSINGGQSTMTVGASMELTASVSNYSGSMTYAWYVNGVDQNVNTASWTCGSALEVGNFTIDVITINTSGTQAGSGSFQTEVDPLVYIAGGSNNQNSSVTLPGYWRGNEWVQLSTLSPDGGYVTSFVTWGTDEYAGGHLINTQGIWAPGYWKNEIWNPLPVLAADKGGEVKAMLADENGVYIAGTITSATGYSVACYWWNGNLITLAPGTYNSEASALFLDYNDIYVAGAQHFFTGTAIGYWKNNEWVEITSNPADEKRITQILVSDSTVYCTGYRSSGFPYIPGYWQNGVWVDLEPNSSISTSPKALLMSGTDLFIAAQRSDRGAGYYKNGIWHTISTTAQGGGIRSLAICGSSIFAAGVKTNQYGFAEVGFWKNDIWVALPGLSPQANSGAEAISLKTSK